MRQIDLESQGLAEECNRASGRCKGESESGGNLFSESKAVAAICALLGPPLKNELGREP